MHETAVAAARTEVVVEAPLEAAWQVFVDGSWWPKDKQIGSEPIERSVIEPREGGRWFERGVDGAECDWGQVLAWEPPHRLVLSWHIGTTWQYDPDPAKASEVEIRFVAESGSRTRVELEHRHLDRHGDGWEAMREAVGSPNGWGGILGDFAAAAAARAA